MLTNAVFPEQTLAANRARTRVRGVGNCDPTTARGKRAFVEPAGGIDAALAADDQLHRNQPPHPDR